MALKMRFVCSDEMSPRLRPNVAQKMARVPAAMTASPHPDPVKDVALLAVAWIADVSQEMPRLPQR
jgi:hypothetical protein